MSEGARSSLQKSRGRSHHPSRLAAFVRNAVHRIGRGHPDCQPMAWTQRRRRARNENLWSFAARAQHRASTARHLHTYIDKEGRCHSVSGDKIALASSALLRKERSGGYSKRDNGFFKTRIWASRFFKKKGNVTSKKTVIANLKAHKQIQKQENKGESWRIERPAVLSRGADSEKTTMIFAAGQRTRAKTACVQELFTSMRVSHENSGACSCS
jgi:hypothetical protein